MTEKVPLPDNWKWTTVGEITLPVKKVFPQKKPNESFTYIDISSIDNKIHRIVEPKEYLGADAPSRARQLVHSSDILFSTVRTYLEKIAIVPEIYDRQIASTGFSVLRAGESVLPRFLFYYSLTNMFLEPLSELQRGTSYPAVRDNDVRVQSFPLPPLHEQDRIVAKIEELFTQLDAGTAALKRIQSGLKRYKASVLKAACEGRLVPQDPSDEPAEKLLRRLGKKPLEGGDLPTLPKGWCWTRVGDIADHRLGKMLDKEKNKGKLHPYIRNINVRWFQFDLSDLQYLRVMNNELENISIQKNDLVVCEGGEPGRAAVWNKDETMIIQKALHRVRPYTGILPIYIAFCLAADASTGRLEKYFTGSTIKHFTGESLHSYIFRLPPTIEQQSIITELERLLSVSAEVEAVIKAELTRAERLRQAILKRAFEGKLLNHLIEA